MTTPYDEIKYYDVQFTAAGIELDSPDDDSVKVIPHIPASQAMAEGDYNFPFQERDIDLYMEENGYHIFGLYAEFTTAQTR